MVRLVCLGDAGFLTGLSPFAECLSMQKGNMGSPCPWPLAPQFLWENKEMYKLAE